MEKEKLKQENENLKKKEEVDRETIDKLKHENESMKRKEEEYKEMLKKCKVKIGHLEECNSKLSSKIAHLAHKRLGQHIQSHNHNINKRNYETSTDESYIMETKRIKHEFPHRAFYNVDAEAATHFSGVSDFEQHRSKLIQDRNDNEFVKPKMTSYGYQICKRIRQKLIQQQRSKSKLEGTNIKPSVKCVNTMMDLPTDTENAINTSVSTIL